MARVLLCEMFPGYDPRAADLARVGMWYKTLTDQPYNFKIRSLATTPSLPLIW